MILSYLKHKEILSSVRLLNRYFYHFTTGYRQPLLYGVYNLPNPNFKIKLLPPTNYMIDFSSGDKNIASIPSLLFYHASEFFNLTLDFFPYLPNTQARTLSFDYAKSMFFK